MAHAEYKITVNKPITEVFNFLFDGLNNKYWRPSVMEISLEDKAPSGVGTSYKQTLKGPMGRNISGDYIITHYISPNTFSFLVTSGPARPQGTYVLERIGSSTQVIFTLDYSPKGIGKLIEPMITKAMQTEVSNLINLKAYLEK